MSSELKLRRGGSAAHSSFIGALGEVTFNTDTHGLHVHDGETPGGFPVGGVTVVIGNGVDDNSAAVAAAVAAGRPILFKGVSVIGTPTTITVPIVNTLSQIFSAASQVTIDNGHPVRPDWWGDIQDSVLKAIAALPSGGGVVKLAIKRYKPNATNYNSAYVSKANVSIIGEKMPTFSANCDRIEGGSVIEGRFNVFADNFHHENVGYDLGKYVCDTYFAGYDSHSANYPLAGGDSTWDAFAFAQPNQGAPLANRKNYTAKNIVGLLRDSSSYGHAILQEGFSGGHIDNVIGMYGIHAHVIKAQNVTAGFIAGYGASTDDVIFKSDSYAHGGNIKVDTVETGKAPPNTTPWSAPAQSSYGLLLNPATDHMDAVKIGKARLHGASCLLGAQGDTTKNLDNLMIEELEIEGYGLTGGIIGMNFGNAKFYRINLGTVTINNVSDGIAFSQTGGYGDDPINIENLVFGGSISLRAIQCLNYGRIIVDKLRATGSVATLYAIDNTGRIQVGKESIAATVTTKFSNSPPALTASWQQYAGNSSFRVLLDNYGVKLTGLLQPVSGGSGNICTLPVYLRPAESQRFPALANGTGDVVKALTLGAAPGVATLNLNEGTNATGAEIWLSLDGANWILD